ncbi:MAG: hypothetical protein K0S45_331 [Nitrospira sp.]|nr:hypothetical protein [Nitrospira sp.]
MEIEDLVNGAVDWELVWTLSKAHGVASLVYRNLAALCPAALPSAIHAEFRRHNQANALLNTCLAKELVAVLDAFGAKGIHAIPFKGVTLAQIAYGDLTLRECADLELIVDEPSIPHARQILWSLGYQPTSRNVRDGPESDECYHFSHKKSGVVVVDLQWVMARPHFWFRLDRSVFWNRLKPVYLPTKIVMGLCPEDMLILLCVDGSKQAWQQLKLICDVAELVRRRPALDWSRLMFQAKEWKCRRMVLLGLALGNRLFDMVLPSAVLKEIEVDADIHGLVQHMPKQLLKNARQGIDQQCAEALYLTMKDSSWERWKLGMALCLAEAKVIDLPLPWFRFQQKLQRLSFCLKPFHWVVEICAAFIRMRQAFVRWLQNAG